jgi:hypothetical protein
MLAFLSLGVDPPSKAALRDTGGLVFAVSGLIESARPLPGKRRSDAVD